ncbi:MAG: M48 family metallopeptidase [Proteobacteria bacterium]|nr:M48 family metallopeptidase [Pseudomonadota bacterium]
MARAPLPGVVALDQDLELSVRINARARRISLKVDPAYDRAVLVLPSARALSEGLSFAESRRAWLRTELAKLAPRVAFADGAVVPYRGEPHAVRHRPEARAGVWRRAGEIHVSGRAEHLPRRLVDWLRAEARRAFSTQATVMAAEIGREVARIGVRDPKSRWGSCAPDGGLSFSWRLVLAPASVLDYVVAHEVAHLVEANHGPDFWALVARLHPGHLADRRWLKQHGAALHRYG